MPTTAYTDGSFVYPSQHGARQVSLPLAQDQEYYATETNRTMMQLQQFWEPSMYQRYSYENVATYSDQLSNAAWTKLNTTVATESSIDAEGDTNASFINETTTNGAHSVSQAIIGTGVVSFGVFLKKQNRTFARLRINNATNGDLAIAVFDLTNGTVASGTGIIRRLSGGYFWCLVTGTATVTTSSAYIELGSTVSTFSYAGTVGTGIYAWRATAVYASSTTPTPGTTAATPAIFSLAAARTVSVPIVDNDDPLSFLVSETPPEQSTLELGVAQWQRGFARVSKQTNVPSSIVVSKPTPLGEGPYILGNNLFFHQPEETVNTYDLYSVVDVDQDYGVPQFEISAGTYTLTVGAYTTASLAYNATAGDVQSALNAIPSVVSAGLATVSGSATVGAGFHVVFGASATYGLFTASLGALSPPPLALVVQGGQGQVVSNKQPYRNYETALNQGAKITAGTYSLTYEGSTTTALSFDATSAQIGAALNALASIQAIGGITMYDGPSGASGYDAVAGVIRIGFYFSTPTITGDVSLLEPPPVTLVVTVDPELYGRTQDVFLAAGNNYRYLNAPGHGVYTGDTIFLAGSYVSSTSPTTAYASTYFVPVTNFTVSDENNIRLQGTPLDEYMTTATISHVGRRQFSNYSPGQQNVRCNKITSYYLPGYTYGIDTAADIPVANPEDDGQPFFDAMIAAGDIDYSVGEIGVWRGPILYQSTITVQAEDLADFQDIPPAVPSQIPGLQIWLDAAQITGKTDGAAMGNGDWESVGPVEASMNVFFSGSAPTYKTAGQGDQAYIRFLRSSFQSMIGSSSYPSTFHIFIIAKVTDTPMVSDRAIMEVGSAGNYKFISEGSTNRWVTTGWNSSTRIYRLNGIAKTNGDANPGLVNIYELEVTDGTVAPAQLILGQDNSASWANVDIYEFACFEDVIQFGSIAYNRLIDGWKDKYAITY